MSYIKTQRRLRQAEKIEPDYVTDSNTGNVILNPKIWEVLPDGTAKRRGKEETSD